MERLTRIEARNRLLYRQGLVDPLPDPDSVLRRLVAVQTQYAGSLEVAVATRIRRKLGYWESRGLMPDGGLAKCWSVRHTLHTQLPEDLALMHSVLAPRFLGSYRRWMTPIWPLEKQLAVETRIEEALREGPLTRRELHERVPDLATLEWAGWGADVKGLAYQGKLKFVGKGGSQAFGLVEASHPSHEDAELELLRRYLRAYGPALRSDYGYWLGVPLRETASAWRRVESELREVEVEGVAKPMYELIEDPIPDVKVPQVRLLSKFDVLTLGHRDKQRWLEERFRRQVFRKAAQVEAVVLWKGDACATWRLDRKRVPVVTVEPFTPLTARQEDAIEAEAGRLLGWMGLGRPEMKFIG